MKRKEQLANKIVKMLNESDLSFAQQLKVIKLAKEKLIDFNNANISLPQRCNYEDGFKGDFEYNNHMNDYISFLEKKGGI